MCGSFTDLEEPHEGTGEDRRGVSGSEAAGDVARA
jgi:hypothetical protein